jgi:hypothetical protein
MNLSSQRAAQQSSVSKSRMGVERKVLSCGALCPQPGWPSSAGMVLLCGRSLSQMGRQLESVLASSHTSPEDMAFWCLVKHSCGEPSPSRYCLQAVCTREICVQVVASTLLGWGFRHNSGSGWRRVRYRLNATFFPNSYIYIYIYE